MILTSSNSQIRKWYKIELRLQWQTNGKSYMICLSAERDVA